MEDQEFLNLNWWGFVNRAVYLRYLIEPGTELDTFFRENGFMPVSDERYRLGVILTEVVKILRMRRLFDFSTPLRTICRCNGRMRNLFGADSITMQELIDKLPSLMSCRHSPPLLNQVQADREGEIHINDLLICHLYLKPNCRLLAD